MKKSRFLMFLLVAIAFYSCNSGIQPNASKYIINFDDSIVDVSTVVSDIEIIELDSTINAIMPSIEDIGIYNDKIYCFSSLSGGMVGVFSLKGKWLFNIKNIGKAQNEWINITNMYINGPENTIVLVDNGLSKVLHYDLNGEFIKSQKFDSNHCYEIGYSDGLYYVVNYCLFYNDEINSGSDHKINIYDESSMKIVGRIIPTKYNDSKIIRNVSGTLKWGNNGIIEVPSLDETVYNVSKYEYAPYASYNYLGKQDFYTEDDIQSSAKNDVWLMGKTKMFYSNAFVESPKYLIRRIGSEFGIDVIYDKNNGKTISTQFDFFQLGSEHLSEKIKYPFPLFFYKDRYYGVMDIDAFHAPENFIDGYISEDLKPLYTKVKENKSNKVIVSYKINID